MHEYLEFFKAHTLLSLAWVGLFAAFIVSVVKSSLSKVKTVDHQQAALLINKQDAKVVDVRSRDEFKKGHIVEAIQISLAAIKNNNASALEKFKARPIIVVCNTGMTSSQAAQLLVKAGFTSVYNLKGGMSEWQQNNLPVAKTKR